MPKALYLTTAKGAQQFFFSNKNKSQFYINNNKNINPYERLSNAYGYSKQQIGQRAATWATLPQQERNANAHAKPRRLSQD